MRDIIQQVYEWKSAGMEIVLATVINTWGSAPRRPGAHMAISENGDMAGSVSGGCVESSVVEAAQETLRSGHPQRLYFGVADETAWDVGLACGGEIEVFVRCFPGKLIDFVWHALTVEQPLQICTILEAADILLGGHYLRGGNDGMERISDREGFPMEAIERLDRLPNLEIVRKDSIEAGGKKIEVLLQSILPSPTLVAIGGAHISIALTKLAKTLGYKTVVIDPRKSFSRLERFEHADEVLSCWPQEALDMLELNSNTAVVTLSHDPKIDDPALMTALRSPVFYIGALGSRGTHQKRLQRLLKAGVEKQHLDKIHSPIGLDIGAQNPEEIALAIMAEIISSRNTTVG